MRQFFITHNFLAVRMLKYLPVLIFAITLAGGSIVSVEWAIAHGGATGVVKDRMMLMKDISKSTKQIASMMRGEVNYNGRKVSELADSIASKGGEKITKLFPEDSLDEQTEALSAIWREWTKFEALSDQLTVAANDLKAASDDQYDAMDSFQKLVGTCRACHRTFRQKKN